MKSTVVAIISNPICAESIVNKLRLADFSNSDVSVLFLNVEVKREFARVKSIKTPEDAFMDAGRGSLLAAIVGWLVGFGTLVISSTGPFIAAGPIFTALSGLAVDSTSDDLSGNLVRLGFSEDKAKLYAGKLGDGYILIAAHAENNHALKLAHEIFERADALDIGVIRESPENEAPWRQLDLSVTFPVDLRL